jgi:hypothetical protein
MGATPRPYPMLVTGMVDTVDDDDPPEEANSRRIVIDEELNVIRTDDLCSIDRPGIKI